MKQLFLLAATILSLASVSQAQETQSNTVVQPQKHIQMHNRKTLAKLNLSDEQKQQAKEINEDYRKQFAELRSNNSMSLGDYKAKTEALKKEQKQKLQDILSPEQKTQLKEQRKTVALKNKKMAGKGFDRMKKELALTDDQSARLKQNRDDFQAKSKAIREDQSLSDSQKKEQLKGLAKQQKENMKAILTPEQLEKMKSRSGNSKSNTVK
jgi:Spy/CpxP family protein refolding chaperone